VAASVTVMTWELSDEHELLRKTVREFAEAEIAPHAAQWDRDAHFPVDVVTEMGELGLFGIVFPERWGGAGGDFASLCVAIEELGRVDQSMGITLSAGVGLGANPIFRFGDDDQRDEWLPDLVSGRRLGAFGLTEPDGGSDAGATRTRAVLDGDEWVLDGSKAFITNCGTSITSIVTATARTDDGISAFVVPAGTPATPTASRSTGAGSRPRICWASRGRGSATSCRSSTTGGSRSRRSPSGRLGPASSCRSSTPSSAMRSGVPSAGSRASRSSCRISPCRSRTPTTSPTRPPG